MAPWRSVGLWVAAVAIVATSGAARIPDGGDGSAMAPGAVTTTSPLSRIGPTQSPIGNVAATVPTASLGPADGAPQALIAGKTYQVVITVWVAAASGPATVDVVTSSGRLIGTASTTVPAGVSRLRYALVTAPVSTHLTIAVRVLTHDGGGVTAAFSHQVR